MNDSTTSTPSGAHHLGQYSKWDQAVAGHIVGRLMLAGILSSSSQADDELISMALVVTAKALAVIPDELKAEHWPRE